MRQKYARESRRKRTIRPHRPTMVPAPARRTTVRCARKRLPVRGSGGGSKAGKRGGGFARDARGRCTMMARIRVYAMRRSQGGGASVYGSHYVREAA